MKNKIRILIIFLLVSTGAACYGQSPYSFKGYIGMEHSLRRIADLYIDKKGYIFTIDDDNNRVQKLDSEGSLVFKFDSDGTDDGRFKDLRAIAGDNKGNIYVIDAGTNSVAKFDSTGRLLLKIKNITDNEQKGFFPLDIDIDSTGNMYVLESNSVLKFDSNGRFLMRFGKIYPDPASILGANDIRLDKDGNVYVLSRTMKQIQKFDPDGQLKMKFGQLGTGDNLIIDPQSIVLDDQDNIYVVDLGSNLMIKKFNTDGVFVYKFGADGYEDGKMHSIDGFAIDENNILYVSDYSYRIQKFTTSGKYVSKISEARNTDGYFNIPTGITTDIYGNIYVVDNRNLRVQKFNESHQFLMSFGPIKGGGSHLFNPIDVAVDAKGNLFVIDQGTYNVKKFSAKGSFIAQYGNRGRNDGEFEKPSSIAIDRQDNVYVVDNYNDRIHIFNSNGVVIGGFGATIFNNAIFSPKAIAVDATGKIYIAENVGHSIQIFDKSGKLLSKFGSYGYDENQFYTPNDIVIDNKGEIYVSEAGGSHSIRKFDASGSFITRFGSYGDTDGLFGGPIAGIAVNPQGIVYAANSARHRVLVFDTGKPYNTVSGRVYIDKNGNCTKDQNEIPIVGAVVRSDPAAFFAITDSAGLYTIKADTGRHFISQIYQKEDNEILLSICPSEPHQINFNNYNNKAIEKDFAYRIAYTPKLVSNVSSDRRRRCFLNTTTINYANTGYADAADTKVHLRLPKHVILKSADKPYLLGKDSVYVFSIGTLKAGESGSIRITDSVACVRNIMGLTACTKVWVTPANSYTLPPDSPWDNSDIALAGTCIENGRVRLVLKNTGRAMGDSAEFRILLDAQLALRKKYKLAAGDSLVLRVPANGRTVRLEADQRPGHPRKAQSNITLEGCAASAGEVVSKGFVNLLPQDDAEPEVAADCQPIIDSFDPNDKQVSPAGTTRDHYTPTAAELKYLLRFQNTGTDTAYTVVVVDTLSEHLDMATLQVGAVSHKYFLNVGGKGRPVLTFTFRNINLPDSARNEPASNGFIQFSIRPKAGLPDKTRIENFADIFFDYNDPIRTNTTFNVMHDVPPFVGNSVRLDAQTVVLSKPTIASFTPVNAGFGEQVTITGTHYQTTPSENRVEINGVQATVVSATDTQLIVVVPQGVATGKVSVTTPGGTAVSEASFVLGTEQPEWSRPIVIHPNPSSGHFTIALAATGIPVQSIEVFDWLGRRILSRTLPRGAGKEEMDLSGRSAGLYTLRFKTQQGDATRRIIIR